MSHISNIGELFIAHQAHCRAHDYAAPTPPACDFLSSLAEQECASSDANTRALAATALAHVGRRDSDVLARLMSAHASLPWQTLAIAAAERGDATTLAQCLAPGRAAFDKSVASASRHRPSPQVNQVMLAHGWPAPLTLDYFLLVDVKLGSDMVSWYLRAGAAVSSGHVAAAASTADLASVKMLRAHYAQSIKGSGALQAACQSGRVDVVEWLLERGEEKCDDMPDSDTLYEDVLCLNAPPLHRAVEAGRVDVVRLLLQSGANVNALSENRKTAREVTVGGDEAAQKMIRALLA